MKAQLSAALTIIYIIIDRYEAKIL